MRSLNIFIIFLFAVCSLIIIQPARGDNPRLNESIFFTLLIFVYWSGMLFFILRLVAAKEIVSLDQQKLTVTKKLFLTLSTAQIHILQVRGIILSRPFDRASGPIFLIGPNQAVKFGDWLTDDGSAREIFDLLSDRLKAKKFWRKLQFLPKSQRTFSGPNAEWVIEEMDHTGDGSNAP